MHTDDRNSAQATVWRQESPPLRTWDGSMDYCARCCPDLSCPSTSTKGTRSGRRGGEHPGCLRDHRGTAMASFAAGNFPEGTEKRSVPEGTYVFVRRHANGPSERLLHQEPADGLMLKRTRNALWD
ncbi:hypothetical protein BD310DRAFT_924103 [Dichomitus squalens]|uniref:Uncharacterized protein n=1 Tax=Dichomitus squalens TaxID=114155 RepID=A0A4Q9PY99_9APHY|nr:hypothetical protein BD310DRAFT_924103 [Dichomitus squalens]